MICQDKHIDAQTMKAYFAEGDGVSFVGGNMFDQAGVASIMEISHFGPMKGQSTINAHAPSVASSQI